MSQNPYESVPSLPKPGESVASLQNPGEGQEQQKPTGLTAIPVICGILGALGALMAVLALVMLAFPGFAEGIQGMQTDPGMIEYQTKMQAFQRTQAVPNLIANGCGLIVGPLLAIGAFAVFGLKEWGRNLLRNTLLLAAIFVVLRGGYVTWMQYRSMEMIEGVTMGQGADTGVVEMIMQASVIIGIVIGLGWIAVLAGFYLWSRSYLNKESIVAYFDAVNQVQRVKEIL